MNVKEFRSFAEYQTIHLRNSKTGKIVAKSQKGLDKFNDIEINGIFTELAFGRDRKYARPIIVCWVYDYDINKISGLERSHDK